MTDSTFHDNYLRISAPDVGYNMADYTNFSVTNNIIDADFGLGSSNPTVWDQLAITGNTITGALTNFVQADFPTNTYSTPGTNLVVVRPNAYETNRANIYVFNWQSLSNVSR